MASPANSEASEIRRRGRQRLIGAVAIALLLIVFVPMVLDSEPRPARQDPALVIPSKESAPALPPPPAPKPTPRSEPTAPASTAKVEPQVQAPKAAVAETAKPVSSAPLKLEGFAVQVGAFRDEAKLQQARDKLAAARIAHYTERLDTSSGSLTRLRAGPFPTREAADSAAATIKRASLEGKVVTLP